jgi:hypothetical protein
MPCGKDKVAMKKKDLVKEHKRLVKTLKSKSHKDDVEEAKHQQLELNDYKRKK